MKLMSRSGATTVSEEAEPFSLRVFLPYQLAVLSARTSDEFSQRYSERFGLGIPEWRILATLGEFGDIRAKDIMSYGQLHKTAISRAVATLRAMKLVGETVNPADKREVFLSLTRKGREVHGEIAQMARAFSDDVFAGLTLQERETLAGLLGKLMDRE